MIVVAGIIVLMAGHRLHALLEQPGEAQVQIVVGGALLVLLDGTPKTQVRHLA